MLCDSRQVALPDHKALQIMGLLIVTYQGHTYCGVSQSGWFCVIWDDEKPIRVVNAQDPGLPSQTQHSRRKRRSSPTNLN
jgi:hypothetical protein